jgi:hypothetical protein
MSPAAGRMLPDGTAAAAAATTGTAARAAVAAGAALVDLTDAGRAVVAEVRDRYPDILICAPDDRADLVRDAATARRTGAILVCADLAAATAAEAGGIDRRGILVESPPERAAGLIAANWPVLVDAGQVAGPHAAAAVAALSAWLGAAAVCSDHVAAVRRAIDMAGAIRAGRPIPGCAPP